MKENIHTILSRYVSKSTPVIIAVSGGVDSMVLLDISKEYFDNDKIFVVHINHGIRKESIKDREIIERYCKENNIYFFYEELKWIQSENKTEENMRKKRYKILHDIKDTVNAKYILTAHHNDDKVETFLFRIIRGTGLYGLLSPKTVQEDILRPMLSINKENIIQYAKKKKLKWIEDITNKDIGYDRNKIREKIIPIAKEIHPTFLENVQTLISDLEKWDQFHKEYIKNWLKKHPVPFSCDEFLKLPEIIQSELLLELVRTFGESLTRGHIHEALKIIERKVGKKKIQLKNKIYLSIKNKKVYIQKD